MAISKEVEMLLARMDTHPEEFVGEFDTLTLGVNSRWNWVIRSVESPLSGLFSEEDAQAIKEKYKTLLKEEARKAIVKQLVSGDGREQEQLELPYITINSTDRYRELRPKAQEILEEYRRHRDNNDRF